MPDLPSCTDPELPGSSRYDTGTDHIPTTSGASESPPSDVSSQSANLGRAISDRQQTVHIGAAALEGLTRSDSIPHNDGRAKDGVASRPGACAALAEQRDRPWPPKAALGSTQSCCWGQGSETGLDPGCFVVGNDGQPGRRCGRDRHSSQFGHVDEPSRKSLREATEHRSRSIVVGSKSDAE